jgi:hypothetical protein
MNLFVTDPSPTLSAQALCDIRLRKMVLETAQMLCTEGRRRGWQGMPYKPTHVNHPVVLSLQNDGTFGWTKEYFLAISNEYAYRFEKDHKSFIKCWYKIPKIDQSLPPTFHNSARNLSLSIDFTHLPIFDAYRAYLIARWIKDQRHPTWTRRGAPTWSFELVSTLPPGNDQ